jgi:hypothetical protein
VRTTLVRGLSKALPGERWLETLDADGRLASRTSPSCLGVQREPALKKIMERTLNALGVRRPVEVSQDASAQHHDSARPRPPDWSASAKQMNSENWKEIELNYCGTQVKGIYGRIRLIDAGSFLFIRPSTGATLGQRNKRPATFGRA